MASLSNSVTALHICLFCHLMDKKEPFYGCLPKGYIVVDYCLWVYNYHNQKDLVLEGYCVLGAKL